MPRYAATTTAHHDTPVKLSPRQPTSELVEALWRAELHVEDPRWHDAAQNVLRGIASLLADDRGTDLSGQGLMTQQQVAGRAHRSLRTVERWWPILMEMGLFTWTRGVPGVGEYQARPGVVRINKRRLIRVVSMLRRAKDRAQQAQRRETRARLLADIRSARAMWVTCLRRSAKPATMSALTPTGDRTAPPRGGGQGVLWDSGPECEHGGLLGRCPSCRRQQQGNPPGAAQATTTAIPDLFAMP